MINNLTEFIVKGWVTGESGRITVIGRCGDSPIHLNDQFDTLYRYKKRKYPDELGDEPVREDEKVVSLRVACIHAYDRSLQVLGQGMTGSLMLEGEGRDLVAPGCVLGHRNGSS
jgi:hypothetical protein